MRAHRRLGLEGRHGSGRVVVVRRMLGAVAGRAT